MHTNYVGYYVVWCGVVAGTRQNKIESNKKQADKALYLPPILQYMALLTIERQIRGLLVSLFPKKAKPVIYYEIS
eukprot:scaffold239435_cov24-Attheya_sp.AAC.1